MSISLFPLFAQNAQVLLCRQWLVTVIRWTISIFLNMWHAVRAVHVIISSMRCSVSSPDEMVRRVWVKIHCATEYFGDETPCWILDVTFQMEWFKKEKLRMQKWVVFHLIFKHSLNINCYLYFLYELLMSLRTSQTDCLTHPAGFH